jgi:uncharacterized protein YbaR (Trm112 family)
METKLIIPEGKCICPVCKGTGRRPLPEDMRRYANVMAGYRASDDTLSCNNCGGQYMFGQARGYVGINRNGESCTHSYSGKTVGNCLHEYVCAHCGDTYQIDSGD